MSKYAADIENDTDIIHCSQFEILDLFSRTASNGKNRLGKSWKSADAEWLKKFPQSHKESKEPKYAKQCSLWQA